MSILMSYGLADRELALKIAGDLKMAGFDIALQEEVSDITRYDKLILVISEAALAQSVWQQPFETFAAAGKLVCSVQLDETELPEQLARFDWVDFRFGYQVGVNGLRAILQMEPKAIPSEYIPPFEAIETRRRIVISTAIAILLLIIGVILIMLFR